MSVTATMNEAIDDLLRASVAAGDVPGVVAMAVDRHGTIYSGAAGQRALGGDVPMTEDTVFWIASMTKALTAAAVMQLVEQGRLSLDGDIGDVVPALAKPRVLEGFDTAGKPILRPARGVITLRHLLTHTAGFVYDTWNADMLAYVKHAGIARHETFIKPENCQPLAFDPGARWEYGINIDWAGKALEAVTGQTLDAYMRQHLFGPLGMNSTGFRLRPEISARMAGPHQRQADGSLAATTYDAPQDEAFFLGGGALYGSAGDYLRFIRMMLNNGELDGVRLLKPETAAAMGANQMGGTDVEIMRTQMPAYSNDCEMFPGMKKKWGLSFLINTEAVPGGRAAGSLAWAGIRNTYYWIDPASGVGGVLMTQILPFADARVLRLLDGFERAVYRLAR